MTEISAFKQQREKLAGICDEHKLVYSFKAKYPITITIRPNSGMEEQLDMLEAAGDEDRIPQDAYITISCSEDGIRTVTGGRFPISKTLRTKVENIFEKMCLFWVRHFYRCVTDADGIDSRLLPEVPEDDSAPETESVTEYDDDAPGSVDMDELSADFLEG
jgi:hypothetical protein